MVLYWSLLLCFLFALFITSVVIHNIKVPLSAFLNRYANYIYW